MESQQNILKQVELLTTNEETLAQLYQTYTDIFPEHEEFWFGLAMQEIDHFNLLNELIRRVKSGGARLYEHPLTLTNLQDFQNTIMKEIDRAKHEPISYSNALTTALQLELTLVNNKYFGIFDSDSEEIREILDLIVAATKRHCKLIKERIDLLK